LPPTIIVLLFSFYQNWIFSFLYVLSYVLLPFYYFIISSIEFKYIIVLLCKKYINIKKKSKPWASGNLKR